MESSRDEIPPPESWEVADLDDRVSRIMLKKCSSSPPASISAQEFVRSNYSDDALNQVDQFLREALEKPRERLSILRMEQDVERFLRDPTQQQLEFQGIPTSYLRLAAHRIAQHYRLQSLAIPDNSMSDGSGSRIVLTKTTESRFPLVRLADIPVNLPQEVGNNVVKVAIKQRSQRHSQNIGNSSGHSSKTSHPKSVEERKEEYNRARARIFSSSGSVGTVVKPESNPTLEDSFQYCSLTPSRPNEKSLFERHEINLIRDLSGSTSDVNKSNGIRAETEPVISRNRTSNRVAIFRDREIERKDPDYDRNYDRYMQRFDPGFGFNGGQYTMQPLYSPAVNYNTEFPQLGPGHRPQVSIERQPRPILQHLHGPWPVVSAPTASGYGPTEGMMASSIPSRVGSHPSASVYMHSSQYSLPFRPGLSLVNPHEHVQPFALNHQQQSEASFGYARPR